MKQFIFLLLTIITTNIVSAQEEKQLFFGVNVGTKLANKNYAGRYNGAYPYTSIQGSELYGVIMNSTINYQHIYQALGDKNFALTADSYPTNVKYSPGILTGVTIGYQTGPNFQMSLDANFIKLKAKNAFTIEVYDPTNSTSEPVIRLGELYAEESRFDGRYNLDYVADGNGTVKFMMGISGLFTAWRMDKFMAIFEGYQMPMFSVHNPTNNIYNKTRGTGWGGGINIGLEYKVNDKIIAQILYQPYQTKVNYGFTITKRLLIQHDFTVRLLWK